MNEQIFSYPSAALIMRAPSTPSEPEQPADRTAPPADRMPSPPDATPASDAGPLRILAVGPTGADLALLHQALEALRPQIDAAPDADTAHAYLRRQPYDLVVLLLPLPGADGVAVCRGLRAALGYAPIVILDAAGTIDVLDAFGAGADVYMSEPIHLGELGARLEALLRRRGGTLRRLTTSDSAWPHPNALDPPQQQTLPEQQTGLAGRPRLARLRSGLTAAWGALQAAVASLRRRLLRLAVVVALIAMGVLGDRILVPAQASTTATTAAASATTQTKAATTVTTATSSASLDAATERAYAIASPSVVYVDNVGVGSGSGVIYDSTGDIVTNAHVVANAQKLTVTLSSGKTYTARIVGTDTADDLAIIHINATGLPAAHFAGAKSYRVAETVLAIGSPLGLQETVTSGLVSALNRTVPESSGAYLPNAIQTSAPINPGNSGGALVDLNGNVVGIPTLEATDPQNNNGGAAQGIGFAVPSSRVTYIAHQLIASGHVAHTGRAYLGVAAIDAQQAQSQAQDPFGQGGGTTTANVTGALVQSVSGPAAQAGVQQGDIITAFNGTTISGQSDLLAALAQQKPGQTVTLTLNRNGTALTVRVQLGELAAA